MTDAGSVQGWLDAYVRAWATYDPQAIGDLFAEDAAYSFTPFQEPVRGRAAIVAAWLAERDTPGTYAGFYEPVAVAGDVAVAQGRSRYFAEDCATLRTEYANVFVLRFDPDGRCAEYREWYMERPENEG